jgi:hypothetical protein
VAESSRSWDYSQEATKLYRRADVIIDRLYPVIHTPQFQGRLPSVLIAVDSLRNRKTLAAYNLVPDEYGLNFKIMMNRQHYADGEDEEGKKIKVWQWGEWAQMETLVHEIGHHWQQMLGKNPFKPRARVTHNKEFTDKMAQLGIHCAPEGYHFKLAQTESPFGLLMAEWGIEAPADIPKEETKIHWFKEGKERKGRSTLTKWSCECGQNIRVGKKDWPGAVCNSCGSQYSTALQQVVDSRSVRILGSNRDAHNAG